MQLCFLWPEWMTACKLSCSLRLKAFKQWHKYGLSGLCDCLWRVRWSFLLSAALQISQTNRRSMFWWPIMCWSRISLRKIKLQWVCGVIVGGFNLLFGICNLTFRTNEQHRSIQSELQSDFAGLWPRLFLFRRFLLFLFLRRRRDRCLCRLHVVDYCLSLLNWLNDICDWWGRWNQV